MRRLVGALLMLLSLNAFAAGDEGELQRLRSALDMLNQEQIAIYQQFQMVQELRRSNYPPPYPGMLPAPSGQIANYDEVVAAQNAALRRSEELAQEASRLVTRYGEIEAAKKPLQEQILELMKSGDK